jgi:hypothetical protein
LFFDAGHDGRLRQYSIAIRGALYVKMCPGSLTGRDPACSLQPVNRPTPSFGRFGGKM